MDWDALVFGFMGNKSGLRALERTALDIGGLSFIKTFHVIQRT